MASTVSAPSSNPYDYERGSTIATRSLISGNKPSETPSSASHDHEGAHDKPVLQRRPTNNYETAVAAAGQSQPKNETTGAVPTGNTDRPGLDRQQSWNMSDYKREKHEQMLSGHAVGGPGYHSTSN